MILFGHPLIPSENFYHIDSIEQVSQTPSNSIVVVTFSHHNIELLNHLFKNNISFAVFIENSIEAVLTHNLGASYLIVSLKNAKEIQSIAEHYLFDAKVLALINDDRELKEAINLRLDGVIYPEVIIKL